jgi:hypothetical protein
MISNFLASQALEPAYRDFNPLEYLAKLITL